MFFLGAKHQKSGFILFLYVRTLPIGVHYVDVAGSARCVQMGEAIEWAIRSRHYDLDRKGSGYYLYIQLFDNEDWKELTGEPHCSLDIEVAMNILKCYDSKKREIHFPKNMKSLYVNTMMSNDDYKGDDLFT